MIRFSKTGLRFVPDLVLGKLHYRGVAGGFGLHAMRKGIPRDIIAK